MAGYTEVGQMTLLASSLCCVGDIWGLSSQSTARVGNALGVIGVTTDVGATVAMLIFSPEVLAQALAAIAIGGGIGTPPSLTYVFFTSPSSFNHLSNICTSPHH